MSDIVRTGRTIREVTYLITKNVRPGVDFAHTAPAGARVKWRGKTNEVVFFTGSIFPTTRLRDPALSSEPTSSGTTEQPWKEST